MNRYIKYSLVAIWMVFIFLFSNQVAIESSALSTKIVEAIAPVAPSIVKDSLTFLVRKSAHIFLYFVLGLLACNVLLDYKLGQRKTIVYSTLFVLLYSITDELHQLFVAGRSGEPRDIIIDTLAGLAGIAVLYAMHKRKKSSNNDTNVLK